MPDAPFPTVHAPNGMVASVDHLASEAGVAVLRAGGSAADAAVAASATLAVTFQHNCGMGGDLFALVHHGAGPPAVLNASGRAGRGADADRLLAEGHDTMPFRGDIRSVPVPGCVDGWLALHGRFGRLPIEDVLAPAMGYAADGFPATPTLAAAVPLVRDVPGADDFRSVRRAGDIVRRPGVARTLAAIARDGRDGFYGGEFGEGLLALGRGEYDVADLLRRQADWVEALGLDVWGRTLWTAPPNSQGYLTLAGAAIAAGLELGGPDDPATVHLLVESARQAGFDRDDVLHDGADGDALVATDRLAARRTAIDPGRAAALGDRYRPGGTIHLAAVDKDRMGVSLIQSNAAGWGAHLVVPGPRIFLQNRGIGFTLLPGHPARYGPGRRPPHTLSPALVTDGAGALDMVIGSMGGDSQPQILLQLLHRLLVANQSPGRAVAAGRWVLTNPAGIGAFDTWAAGGDVAVALEGQAATGLDAGLAARGHRVERRAPFDHGFGHAHVIAVGDDVLAGASDPRPRSGRAAGY